MALYFLVEGAIQGTIGAVLANVVGTTGASMLLVRPLLRTNSERRHVVRLQATQEGG